MMNYITIHAMVFAFLVRGGYYLLILQEMEMWKEIPASKEKDNSRSWKASFRTVRKDETVLTRLSLYIVLLSKEEPLKKQPIT